MENQNGLRVKAAAHESKWEISCGNAEPVFILIQRGDTDTTEHIHSCPGLVCAGDSIWLLPACPLATFSDSVRGEELGHGWPHHEKTHSSDAE